MKALVTGFEPFGGEQTNPAYEAVALLPERIDSVELIKAKLPVSFNDSGPALAELIRKYQPDVVICVGQAGGYAAIAVERVAINLRDAAAPDNSGVQPEEQPITADGPDAYFSSLPVKKIVAAMRHSSIPAFISNSAGTFVCNNVMYTLLDLIHRNKLPIRGGFIHVPYSSQQVVSKAPNTPSMELTQMARGLEAAIRALL